MHHDGIHAIGHGEGLEVAFDGDGKWQFVDEVHRCARDNGTAAQVLQAEYWADSSIGTGKGPGPRAPAGPFSSPLWKPHACRNPHQAP